MLKLIRLANKDNTEFDVFRNRENNFCCLEHDFGSPMISDVTSEKAADWLIQQGVSITKDELIFLLAKIEIRD